MEMDIAMGLAGAVIGLGAGFVTCALMTIGKVADTREEAERAIRAQGATIDRLSSQLADYRAADQRRTRQRKAALAKAREVNAARNAAKTAKA